MIMESAGGSAEQDSDLPQGSPCHLEHIVRWSILIKDGAPLVRRVRRIHGDWGQRSNPPAIFAVVSGLAVPGALWEVEVLAAVPSAWCCPENRAGHDAEWCMRPLSFASRAPCPPQRWLTISAAIETAVSSGVRAPRSRPTGLESRSSSTSLSPASRSR